MVLCSVSFLSLELVVPPTVHQHQAAEAQAVALPQVVQILLPPVNQILQHLKSATTKSIPHLNQLLLKRLLLYRKLLRGKVLTAKSMGILEQDLVK